MALFAKINGVGMVGFARHGFKHTENDRAYDEDPGHQERPDCFRTPGPIPKQAQQKPAQQPGNQHSNPVSVDFWYY